jgi:ketosteroid isomerase-like protein
MTIARVLDDYCDAWRAGDLARIVDAYHDDFTLHYFGESPLAGTHRGKASALAALGEATRRSSRQLVEIVDVLAGRELGAIVAVERVGPAGQTTDIRRVLVYRVRDELLVECWLYDENQRLVDALWSG